MCWTRCSPRRQPRWTAISQLRSPAGAAEHVRDLRRCSRRISMPKSTWPGPSRGWGLIARTSGRRLLSSHRQNSLAKRQVERGPGQLGGSGCVDHGFADRSLEWLPREDTDHPTRGRRRFDGLTALPSPCGGVSVEKKNRKYDSLQIPVADPLLDPLAFNHQPGQRPAGLRGRRPRRREPHRQLREAPHVATRHGQPRPAR